MNNIIANVARLKLRKTQLEDKIKELDSLGRNPISLRNIKSELRKVKRNIKILEKEL